MARTYHHDYMRQYQKAWEEWMKEPMWVEYPFNPGDPQVFSYNKEPRWWRKLFKTKKRRAEVRRCLYKALTLPEEDVIFPLDKKPWIYYY